MTPIAIGDGHETEFQTPLPYKPHSLTVTVEGVRQAPTETDPTTGLFTLPYAPRSGAVIAVGFVIASLTQTGVPLALPTRELGPAPGTGVTDVAATNSDGTAGREYANTDHAHKGVHKITAGGADLYGNVTLAAGSNVTITQSGGTVTIASTGGGGGSSGWTAVGTDTVQLESGRYIILEAAGAASIQMSGGEIYLIASAKPVVLEPGNLDVVLIDTGVGLVLPALASDPSNWDVGHIYYNTTLHRIRLWDGTEWVDTSTAQKASSPPTADHEGQHYYDTTNQKEYVWDGSTWNALW